MLSIQKKKLRQLSWVGANYSRCVELAVSWGWPCPDTDVEDDKSWWEAGNARPASRDGISPLGWCFMCSSSLLWVLGWKSSGRRTLALSFGYFSFSWTAAAFLCCPGTFFSLCLIYHTPGEAPRPSWHFLPASSFHDFPDVSLFLILCHLTFL